jgi:hypothetical protein
MSHGHQHRSRLCLALVGCALAISACGSSSTSSTGTGTGSSTIARLDKYSACMRDHGVSGFPDPSTTESPNSFGVDGYNFDLPTAMDTQSPAYVSASALCGKQLDVGPGSGGGHGIPEAAKLAALKHAECMRAHGVPNYPDPVFSNGGVSQSSGGPGANNVQAPAFQQAQKACAGR